MVAKVVAVYQLIKKYFCYLAIGAGEERRRHREVPFRKFIGGLFDASCVIGIRNSMRVVNNNNLLMKRLSLVIMVRTDTAG